MSRPTIKDNPEMLKELAIIVAGILNEDFEEDEDVNDEDYKYSSLGRISNVLKRHYDDDAYELAKKLEDEGFSMEASIVSDLDVVSSHAHDIINKYTTIWVIENKIAPKLTTGTEVQMPIGYKDKTGVIVEINITLAKYSVRTPSQNVNSRYILPYEKIEIA